MILEKFLQLTKAKGLEPQEERQRDAHMRGIYDCAKELGISNRLTLKFVGLLVHAYEMARSDETAHNRERYH